MEDMTEERPAARPGSPYIITCIVFVAISIFAISIEAFISDDFVVRPHEQEPYLAITSEVAAGAAIIYDIGDDRIVAGKHPTAPKSIASITKLTAGLIAFSRLDETDRTVIRPDDFSVVLSSASPLRLGDTWRSTDLLEYSLITSSNRGIHAVGRTIEEKTGSSIVDLMNAYAQESGLVQTHFVNPTGLDAHSALSGSESSALDLAKMAAMVVSSRGDLAALTTRRDQVFYSLDGTRYDVRNTNTLLGVIPEPVLLSKTGYTDMAGGALIMVVEKKDRQVVFVVLDSTRTGRFEDMETLLFLYDEIA